MDPLSSLNTKKDSTLAMINAAQKRGLEIFYLEQRDVFLSGDKIMGSFRTMKIDPQILKKNLQQTRKSLGTTLERESPWIFPK